MCLKGSADAEGAGVGDIADARLGLGLWLPELEGDREGDGEVTGMLWSPL